MGCCGGAPHYVKPVDTCLDPNYVIHRLIKILTKGQCYGMVGTDGQFQTIFTTYVKYSHTLLSVFYEHPLHPFSKRERVMFLFTVMGWMFMIAAVFAAVGTDTTISIIVNAILVIPFKMFVRYMLECPCLYNGGFSGYNYAENKRRISVTEAGSWIIECFGSIVSASLCCLSILFWVLGGVFASAAGGDSFVLNWIFSQLVSNAGAELLYAAMHVTFALYVPCFNEDKHFHQKWSPIFPKIEECPCVSLSQVAYVVKSIHIARDGPKSFADKYPNWDEHFYTDTRFWGTEHMVVPTKDMIAPEVAERMLNGGDPITEWSHADPEAKTIGTVTIQIGGYES
jgi:hypothetical protein